VGGCTGSGVFFRVCRLMYPACSTHKPFFSAASLVPPYFSMLSHKRHNVRKKKLLNLKFSVQHLFQKIFYSKKKSARHCHKCEHVFTSSGRYSCRILTKLIFSQQIFKQKPEYQILSKSFLWEPSCSTYGQTDRQDKVNSRFSQFC
jgi:hypothetical protein